MVQWVQLPISNEKFKSIIVFDRVGNVGIIGRGRYNIYYFSRLIWKYDFFVVGYSLLIHELDLLLFLFSRITVISFFTARANTFQV